MTGRLRLSTRIGLIVAVALFAGWLGVIAASFIAQGPRDAAALPAPARLAALAQLIDASDAAQRALVLEATRSPRLSVRIEPGLPDPAASSRFRAPEAQAIDAYREALGERPFAAVAQSMEGRFPKVFASAFNAVDFHIGLDAGETLVVSVESPFSIHPNGLPIGFGAGLLGLGVALATLVLLHREFRPLARLAKAVDRVDPTGETAALPPIHARSPELRGLIAAFERMQDRVATLLRARLALVGGIQHDLRTFATRLRLRVDKIADAEERRRAVADIADMIALMDDALLASRAGARELDEEMIEIGPLIAAEAADRRKTGADVSFEAAPGAEAATVLGDRVALRRIVANLTENALTYGSAARLSLANGDGTVALRVDDDGPGVPPERRAELLEPFTRLEGSRARRTGGAGLGLAVVRSLTEAHGGSIRLDRAPGGGARVIVQLPLFAP